MGATLKSLTRGKIRDKRYYVSDCILCEGRGFLGSKAGSGVYV